MKPDFTIDSDSLPALVAFTRVARLGSFTAASAALAVSPSAVSQTIRHLEDRLGVRLLQRTTRRVGLTEAGAALLARVEPALAEIHAATDDIRQQRDMPAGTLRLTSSHSAVVIALRPILTDFMRAYPTICVDLVTDDRFVDLIAEGFDAGLRLGEALQQDMVAIPVTGPLRMVVAASPDYLARHGTPQTPHELHRHACLPYRFGPMGSVYRWEFARGGRPFTVDIGMALIANDKSMLHQAALAGLGLIYEFPHHIADALASGALVTVLDEWTPPFSGFYLYYPSRALMPPKLRVFVDFLKARELPQSPR
ncbi:MAG: LysR family transcriptional regulator [Cupriavidus sp.]|jgi:DNA-binding transcriptional LysR family regulator|uniref:LysR family transcriptional regulator n=1 Tax=Cupriavidus pauculus TaxID=82633 RepID=UPI000C60879D|nr:LysR family transcriptional regulator [Cupriavidus pauculus]KAB0599879.1 LysR family transcriptional regulator [Cupriavidus pauculus]MBU65421.1 LysR family transcriptional regulator [Cupriavidus sp.]MCM3604001.1 LysR family transcriptional regulator [Cupriavidus pauculus]UAL01206.1 LysR family transcriptional regulator [Cupriavidus pauculus]